MSLNHVVNNLIRAAASIPQNISDTDLDKHVAQLLANEAKAKEKSWSELGLGAYLGRGSADPNAPKPNKRFLASVIRNVDGHNAAVIRAQNQAAREAREARRGESSRNAAASAASRLFGGAMRGLQKDERDRSRRSGGSRMRGWDEEYEEDQRGARDREDERRPRRYGEEDRHDGDRSVRSPRGHRSTGDEHYPRRRERERGHEGSDDRRRSHRPRSRSRSRSREKRRRRHEEDEEQAGVKPSKTDVEERFRNDHDHRHQDKSPKKRDNHETKRDKYAKYDEMYDKKRPPPPPADLPPPSPSPPPPPPRISRMDKYFETEYDPRLDYGDIPATGPVVDVAWDNMLAILKERGQKRRVRSPGLFDDEPVVPVRTTIRDTSPDIDMRKYEKAEKKKRKEERRKRRAGSDESEDERRRRKEKKAKESATVTAPADGDGLFDMKYTAQGATREWDKGK